MATITTVNRLMTDVAIVGTDKVTYVGKSSANNSIDISTLTGESVWQIIKYVTDSNGITTKYLPVDDNGQVSEDYKFIWDDRKTLVLYK